MMIHLQQLSSCVPECNAAFFPPPLQPNMTGPELDKLRAILLRHCDVNKDGKIQRNELALCLGVKHKP